MERWLAGRGGKGEDRNGREHRDAGENKRNRNRPGKRTQGEKIKRNGKAFGVGGLKPGGSKKGETNKKKGGT